MKLCFIFFNTMTSDPKKILVIGHNDASDHDNQMVYLEFNAYQIINLSTRYIPDHTSSDVPVPVLSKHHHGRISKAQRLARMTYELIEETAVICLRRVCPSDMYTACCGLYGNLYMASYLSTVVDLYDYFLIILLLVIYLASVEIYRFVCLFRVQVFVGYQKKS